MAPVYHRGFSFSNNLPPPWSRCLHEAPGRSVDNSELVRTGIGTDKWCACVCVCVCVCVVEIWLGFGCGFGCVCVFLWSGVWPVSLSLSLCLPVCVIRGIRGYYNLPGDPNVTL